MSGVKGYSAGTIFLQVVPVFTNLQRDIDRQTDDLDKNLGDRMERAGKNAGHRAGRAAGKAMGESMDEETRKFSSNFERDFHKNIQGINRSLGDIDTKRLSNNLRKELAEVKREIKAVGDVDISADADFARVYAALTTLKARVQSLRDNSKLSFRADFDDVNRGLDKTIAKFDSVKDKLEFNIGADLSEATRSVSEFEKRFKISAEKAARYLSGAMGPEIEKVRARLESLQDVRIDATFDSRKAREEARALEAELDRLGAEEVNPEVDLALAKAKGELAIFNAQLDALDRRRIDVEVDVDKKRGLADASNSFRSFNAILLLTTTIGPALVPILAAVGGGLLALGPAAAVAGAGASALVVGFTGLGDALTALNAREDQAIKTAETLAKQQKASAYAIADAKRAVADAERNAARAAEQAAERVKDAREATADAIESAMDRQKKAHEDYRDSIVDVREAEAALREARRDAAKTGDDIGQSLKSNQLAIDQAVLDSFDATVTYNATMADGSSTNYDKEAARIAHEKALLNIQELRDKQADLVEEKKKWDQEGIDGVDKVKTAQERLDDAIRAQKDSYKDLGEATKAVDEARIDGAKRISDAIEAQNRSLEDNARAVESSVEALRRARETAADTAAITSSQDQAVEAAFAKLGKAGREFALWLFSMRSGFYQFRDDVQTILLPAIQEAITGFMGSDNADVARSALIELTKSFARLARALSKSLQGSAWGAFFQMLADLGPQIQDAYGKAFISFMEAIASILTTVAPYALMFAEGFANMMESFAGWAESEDGQKAIIGFMDWMVEIAPDVLSFFGSLFKAFGAIVTALAPWGDVVLKSLSGFLDVLTNLDPKILATLSTAFIVLIGAAQAAYGVQNMIMAFGALASLSIGPWILAIGLILAAIAALYIKNEDFRDFVKDAWEQISGAVSEAWETYLKPALTELWDAVKQLWDEVLAPFFGWLGPLLVQFATVFLPLVLRYFSMVFRAMAWFIKKVFIPVINAIVDVIEFMWKYVFKPALGFILALWKFVFEEMKWMWKHILWPVLDLIGTWVTKVFKTVFGPQLWLAKKVWGTVFKAMAWTWDHVLKPVFNWIADKALPALKGAFDSTVEAIGNIWNRLKELLAAPVRFVIETVINNGLIKGFNKIANWIGSDEMPEIKVPNWAQSGSGTAGAGNKGRRKYAAGGVLPGYTPGRDVHSFFSPSAGRLDLSGGEAIMRPEWTQAMGRDYIDHMNGLARTGGAAAIRRSLGGYWLGGVLPLLGGRVSSHGNMYGHPAFDINGPGNDYGQAIRAWKSGSVAQMNYIGDRSYGRWVVLNHPGNESSLYAHMSAFGPISVGQAVAAGQMIGRVGDLGRAYGAHLHFEIKNALADYSSMTDGDAGGSTPGWLASLVRNPFKAVKNWVLDPVKDAAGSFADSDMFRTVARVPLALVEKTVDKVWDIVPGWVKTGVGWASEAADWAIGGVKGAVEGVGHGAGAVADALGFADGGVLPYNGTMKYDNGGLLPTGLTSVLNLTGRPEPVFTSEQWNQMSTGGGDGATIHYEPHFEGSNLTAEDVAADLNFTYRRIRRAGKYAGVGES